MSSGNTARDWTRLLDSSNEDTEKPRQNSVHLYASTPLDRYDQDTLRLNSRYVPHETGKRHGRVGGRDIGGDWIYRGLQVAIEAPEEAEEERKALPENAMAIVEQMDPSFASDQVVSYTLFPPGYGDIQEPSDITSGGDIDEALSTVDRDTEINGVTSLENQPLGDKETED